jgi:hypothetical protein
MRQWGIFDRRRLHDVPTCLQRDERSVARFWDRFRWMSRPAPKAVTLELLCRSPAEVWTGRHVRAAGGPTGKDSNQSSSARVDRTHHEASRAV